MKKQFVSQMVGIIQVESLEVDSAPAIRIFFDSPDIYEWLSVYSKTAAGNSARNAMYENIDIPFLEEIAISQKNSSITN